jgi:hypothetical protein
MYEKRDVHARPLVMFGIGLLILTGIVLVLMAWMFGQFEVRAERVDVPESPLTAGTGGPPPEPRLQVLPRIDLSRQHSEEDALLNQYGWVDRGAGIARIPIDRAMDLLVQKGLPMRTETTKEPRK